MASAVLDRSAILCCPHGGLATPPLVSDRVRVNGQPVVTLAGAYIISGCSLPAGQGGPCRSAHFLTGAARLSSNGQPVLLHTSASAIEPGGARLTFVSGQVRVTAT